MNNNICVTTDPLETTFWADLRYNLLKITSKNYAKVYFLSMYEKDWLFDCCEHIRIPRWTGSKTLNSLLFFIFGSLKLTALARNCNLIRADGGGSYEINAAFASFVSRRPLVVSLRYNSAEKIFLSETQIRKRLYGYLFLGIMKMTLRQANVVLTSHSAMQQLAINLGVNPSRIILIPTPVDTSVFNPADKSNARKNLELGEETIILFVGRLRPEKNVGLLIKSFRLITQISSKTSRLILVGDCPFKDYLTELKSLCQQLGLSKRVTFVGRIAHKDLPSYYAAADVFVLPSITEGVPKALLEAMAMGRPIVTTKVGGIKDLAEGKDNMLFAKVGDEEDLAKKILTVLEDDKLATQLGHRARQTINTDYSIDVVYGKYRHVIDTYGLMVA